MTGAVEKGGADTEEYGHRSEGNIGFATYDQNAEEDILSELDF